METSMKITRLGATGKSIVDGKEVSARIFVTGTITQEVTCSVFVNADEDPAQILAGLKVGTQIPIVSKVTEDGRTFWNVQRASMPEKAILEVLKAAPKVVAKKNKSDEPVI